MVCWRELLTYLIYPLGLKAIVSKLDDLKMQQAEILALLEVIDVQVEALFDIVKNPDVPAEAAAALKEGLDAIQAAAEKITVDDEPVEPPAGE